MERKAAGISDSLSPNMEYITSHDNPYREQMLQIISSMGLLAKYHRHTDKKELVQVFNHMQTMLTNRKGEFEKHASKAPERKFPIQVMYLHENRNLIGKNIGDQADFDELVESSFVKAYWEINSIGAAIRMLIQASDLNANPEQLLENFNNWNIESILDRIDDQDFANLVRNKKKEWEVKLVADQMTLKRFTSVFAKEGEDGEERPD
jgi:hypothetical protein